MSDPAERNDVDTLIKGLQEAHAEVSGAKGN